MRYRSVRFDLGTLPVLDLLRLGVSGASESTLAALWESREPKDELFRHD